MNTVTGILKDYFRELKPDLISCDGIATHFDPQTGNVHGHAGEKIPYFLFITLNFLDLSSEETRQKIREYLQNMQPTDHYDTLKYLMRHLRK